MTRLEQALAIRDGLLKLHSKGHWEGARTSLRVGMQSFNVPLPGFKCSFCRIERDLLGVYYQLNIWPDTGRPAPRGGTEGGPKVLLLEWDDDGHAKLVSIRKPQEWVATVLALLDPSVKPS
jgi:hypothetical protein